MLGCWVWGELVCWIVEETKGVPNWVEGEREVPTKVEGLFVVGFKVVGTGDAWIEVKEVAGTIEVGFWVVGMFVVGMFVVGDWVEGEREVPMKVVGLFVVGFKVVWTGEHPLGQLQFPNENPFSILNLSPPQMFVSSKVELIWFQSWEQLNPWGEVPSVEVPIPIPFEGREGLFWLLK